MKLEKYMYYAAAIATTLLIVKLSIDLRREALSLKLKKEIETKIEE